MSASVARRDWPNSNAGGEGRSQDQSSAPYLEQHRVAGVDHTHAGTFTETEGSESTSFIGRTFDVNDRSPASGWTGSKSARGACVARIVLLQSWKYDRRRQVPIDENVSQTR